jgi:putative endonuclease
MLEGETLALIEVRSRSSEAFGGAAGSVDFHKQRRIVIAARHLLMVHPLLSKRRARFDVVAVAKNDKMEWLKDAFRL